MKKIIAYSIIKIFSLIFVPKECTISSDLSEDRSLPTGYTFLSSTHRWALASPLTQRRRWSAARWPYLWNGKSVNSSRMIWEWAPSCLWNLTKGPSVQTPGVFPCLVHENLQRLHGVTENLHELLLGFGSDRSRRALSKTTVDYFQLPLKLGFSESTIHQRETPGPLITFPCQRCVQRLLSPWWWPANVHASGQRFVYVFH